MLYHKQDKFLINASFSFLNRKANQQMNIIFVYFILNL